MNWKLLRRSILILFSASDEHAKLAETQHMFDAAKEPKQLVIFDGAKHEDLLLFDEKLYTGQVIGFLNRYLAHDADNKELNPFSLSK